MVFYRQGCRAKGDLSAAAFCMVRSDAPFALRSVPLGETALTRFPLLAQLSFAYKRALPQSKLMDENSCAGSVFNFVSFPFHLIPEARCGQSPQTLINAGFPANYSW